MGQSRLSRQAKAARLAGLILAAAGLVGCAGHAEYYASIAEANARIAESEQARYAALTELASTGDSTAAMAAAMALAMSPGSRVVEPQALRPIWLDVLSITAGPLANIGIAGIQASISRDQIAANRDVSISTNNAFVGLGTAGINGVGAAGAAGAAAVRDTARAGLSTIERITLEPTP